jgi:hypothetical protein
MDTRKLEETSRLVGSISWAAIASGVFIALALQILLSLLGLAFGLSVGDRAVGGGYAFWAVLVQLVSIGVGAALAARIAHATRTYGGIAAGIMVWAVALVIGGALPGFMLVQRFDSTVGAWAAFIGAAISLLAAILGGILGSSLGHRPTSSSLITTEPEIPVISH